MSDLLGRRADRFSHLAAGNPLRALTEVIDRVAGGINLGQGVCDLDPPRPLCDAAVAAIGSGTDRQTYTPYRGLPELRRQIDRKLSSYSGLEYGEDGVCATLGSSGALFAAVMALLEPGDEVLLFEPFYSYHRSVLRLAGCLPVAVPLQPGDWALDTAALRAAITPRTRALVLNTPANPTGKVFSTAELAQIADALAGTDVLVLTDEVYEYMVFDGRRHVSPAAVPGLTDRTLTLGSFSKTFSITGWRVGFVAGPPEVVDAVGKVCDQIHVCAPRPMQRGVAAALADLPASFYEDLRSGYERRRDRFCDALAAAGFRFARPEGAYYVLADYSAVLGDLAPYDAARALIDRARINAVPGDLFHDRAEGVRTLRFHFAVDDEVLDEVGRRLRAMA